MRAASNYSDRLAFHAKAGAKANQQGLEYDTLNSQLNEDRSLLEKYQAEYIKLRDNEMLNVDNENKHARAYCLYR
jgi:hypothetical protein